MDTYITENPGFSAGKGTNRMNMIAVFLAKRNRRYTQMDADLLHRICVYPRSSAVKNIRENFQEKPRLLRQPKEIIQRIRLSYVIPTKTKAKFYVFLTEHNYESG
jgi:hypothetical protein